MGFRVCDDNLNCSKYFSACSECSISSKFVNNEYMSSQSGMDIVSHSSCIIGVISFWWCSIFNHHLRLWWSEWYVTTCASSLCSVYVCGVIMNICHHKVVWTSFLIRAVSLVSSRYGGVQSLFFIFVCGWSEW